MRACLAVMATLTPLLHAQMTLRQAVDRALTTYPAIEASAEQAKAAASGVALARTAYLPRVDFLGQVNRATHNNVFGLVLPQPLTTIPNISGPVLGTNSLDTVWGTTAGVLVSWEPFDFGLRKANVAVADAARARVAAAVAVTKLQAAAQTADAFLGLQAAQETVQAASAAVTRAETLDRIIGALVRSELRPGAEASRARAEVAAAKIQLIQAQEAVSIAKVALAEMTGAAAESIDISGISASQATGEPPAASVHPAAIQQQAAVAEAQARERALSRAYAPKINVEGSAYGRGTGIQPNGATGGFASGLGPNVRNWALGFNIAFPAFDFAAVHARQDAEAHRELAEQARLRQLNRDLNAQVARAHAVLEAARRIAENAPVQVEAARAAETQARARYQAGLANMTDVADTERLLTQSEIDAAVARLNVWRALLGVAVAQGDLKPFLDSVESK